MVDEKVVVTVVSKEASQCPSTMCACDSRASIRSTVSGGGQVAVSRGRVEEQHERSGWKGPHEVRAGDLPERLRSRHVDTKFLVGVRVCSLCVAEKRVRTR